jgi:parallel beta helix pectate lyase-like protein
MRHKKTLAALAAGVVTAALVALAATGPASSGGTTAKIAEWQPAPLAHASGPAALPSSPNATIQRTFVSTSGSDANPCTLTAPCRSFPVAIAATTAGGEVVALNSGGYGAFTVPKSLTIVGAPGEHVALTAFAGVAIDVNAGAGDVVVLRNLYLTGLGATTGILLESQSSLHVDSVLVTNFTNEGLSTTADGATVFVRDSMFRRNGTYGLAADGAVDLTISSTRFEGNDVAMYLTGGATGDIDGSAATKNTSNGFVFEGADGTIARSTSTDNGGNGVLALGAGTEVMLSSVVLTDNATNGVLTQDGTPVVRIGGSTVTRNDVGLLKFDGTLESFGDNLIRGNTTTNSSGVTTVGRT